MNSPASSVSSPAAAPPRVLDLSGYGFSGKHAVIDLVREFQGYHVEHFQFEFAVLRMPGGILDLKTALVDDWSLIRADAAIRRFRRLIRRIGVRNRLFDPSSWFTAIGWNYDRHYRGRFIELSEKYVERLTDFTWTAPWPFAGLEWSGPELFWRKLKSKLRFEEALALPLYFSRPENFDAITRDYLAELLASNVEPGARTIVMHNAFEPFNPARSLPFFHAAKCIIVDRDPRDNYVAGLWYRPMRLPVDQFIRRYRVYREVAAAQARPLPQVLRMQYEDLVLNYEASVEKILAFLGEERSVHLTPRRYFDPAVSRKNVGLWRQYPQQQEIEQIRAELADYCHAGA